MTNPKADRCAHDHRTESFGTRAGRRVIAIHCEDCGKLIGEIESIRVACERCGKPVGLASGACFDCGTMK